MTSDARDAYAVVIPAFNAAATLGEDAGKPRLAVGDTFELGDRWWRVVGLMRTRGTTYGSEVWTGVENPVVRATGKGDKTTEAACSSSSLKATNSKEPAEPRWPRPADSNRAIPSSVSDPSKRIRRCSASASPE